MFRAQEHRHSERAWPLLALFTLLLGVAGCTQEQATPFGKVLFGLMVALFVVIPIVFWRGWRRDRG